jgi:tetratricopeptide (TPR) repeat protein
VVLSAAVSAVLVLVLAVAGLAVNNRLLERERQQTLRQRDLADAQRQEAERRRRIAESNFQRACVLLHNAPLHDQLEWLKHVPKQSSEATLKEALALFQSLLTEPGSDPGDRLLTAQMHRELGNIYVELGRHAEAAQEFRRAVALLRPLAAEFPQEAGFRDSLAHCLSWLGWGVGQKSFALAPAQLEEAEADYTQAISLYEVLREEFRDAPWYRQRLADCWNGLGGLRRRNGRFRQAEEALRRALALQQRLFDEFPQGSDVLVALIIYRDNLAWLLLIRPDRQPRHAAEALELAQKGAESEPWNHDRWHTLGVAHCRLGHWKEALACIAKSRQLEKKPGPPDSYDRFFEAMAYSGLGERDKARRCYDEGVRWMEEHAPEHADLRRFRDEAARMLGIGNRE